MKFIVEVKWPGGGWTPTANDGGWNTLKEAEDACRYYADRGSFEYRVKPAEPVPAAVTAATEPVSGATQAHYAALAPEPISVIEGWGLNYRLGNAVKYLARAGKKVEGLTPTAAAIKDLEKSITYIRREINALKGKSSWS